MIRLEVPVRGKVLWHTGDVKLWVELEVRLKDRAGNWYDETFLVDSGAEITTYPAYDARQFDLPMPQQAVHGITHTQTSLEMRSGMLRFQLMSMDTTEYAVPCLFLGDPDNPPAGPPAGLPRKLLQPLAFLDQLQFLMKKDPASTAIHGLLIVEKN